MVTAAVLVVALAATAPAALAQKHPAAPRPDLTIEDAAITHPAGEQPFVFQNQRNPKISISDRNVNVGRGRAGRSVTKVYLEHGGKRWLLAKRKVGPIAPGAQDFGHDVLVDTMNFPLGAYTAEICADANHANRESTRKPQCARAGALDFIVAAARWTGSVSGEYDPALGNVEKWTSSNAELAFSSDEAGGIFEYAFLGTVTWTSSGTDDDGCVWSGSGSQTFTTEDQPIGSFSVDYKHEEYSGSFALGKQIYQANVACPGGGDSMAAAPEAPGIIASGLGGPAPLPFGSTSLPGSPTHGLLGTTFNWNLRPAAP